MPTYSKETALFDTGKIGDDINDAAGQVNKYITQIGDTGIKVHPYDSTNEQVDTDNYTKIDANGMEVYQNIDGASTKVASFGSDGATIGQTELATFCASGINFYSSEGGNRHKTFSIDSTGVVIYTEVMETSAEITTASSPVTHVLSHKPSTSQGHNSFGFACPSGNNPAYYLNAGNPITFQWGYRGVNDGVIEYDGDITCTITPPSSLGTDTVTARFYYEYEIVAPYYDIGTRDGAAGKYSAVIGEDLQAIGDNSVAVGKFNDDPHGGMLFSIGNGTADNARSNAMFVDFLGNVTAAGDITDGSGNVLSDAVFPDASGNLTAAGDITDGGGNVLSNKLDASTLADYVTEQASNGDWRYRKWHSGRVEAWFNDSITMSATTAQGNLYRRSATLAIPSGIFTIAPGVIVGSQASDNTIVSVKGSASSATSIAITDYRTNSLSSMQSRAIRVYAWQNPTS